MTMRKREVRQSLAECFSGSRQMVRCTNASRIQRAHSMRRPAVARKELIKSGSRGRHAYSSLRLPHNSQSDGFVYSVRRANTDPTVFGYSDSTPFPPHITTRKTTFRKRVISPNVWGRSSTSPSFFFKQSSMCVSSVRVEPLMACRMQSDPGVPLEVEL